MIDRRSRKDRFLEWKVWVFCLGAVVALAGIYLEERWLTGIAIVLLASAAVFRFLPGGGRTDLDDDPEGDDSEAAEAGM